MNSPDSLGSFSPWSRFGIRVPSKHFFLSSLRIICYRRYGQSRVTTTYGLQLACKGKRLSGLKFQMWKWHPSLLFTWHCWEFIHVVIVRQAGEYSPAGQPGAWLQFYYYGRTGELASSFYHSLPLQPSKCQHVSFFPLIECTCSLAKGNNSESHHLVQKSRIATWCSFLY